MTATYTWDIFCSLDGYGSHHGDWGGYWGKQGPELLEHRDAQYVDGLRMVLGATTYREFVQMRGSSADGSGVEDAWVTRMRSAPLTVVASSLEEPLDWPDATVASPTCRCARTAACRSTGRSWLPASSTASR